MRNFIIPFFIFFVSAHSSAALFRVSGPLGQVLFQQELKLDHPQSVGQITIDVLQKNKISYNGSDEGILRIFDFEQVIQVISGSEIKAYGWCYALNGKLSELMPDQAMIDEEVREIFWFYGYAHYLNGEWIGQCLQD